MRFLSILAAVGLLVACTSPATRESTTVIAISAEAIKISPSPSVTSKPTPVPTPEPVSVSTQSPVTIAKIATGKIPTFDDCEDEIEQGMTIRFIEVLNKYRVTFAIFFLTGDCYNSRPDLVRLIKGAGFEIGNHTKSHPLNPDLRGLSIDRVRAEIEGGPPGAKYFRAPGGGEDARVRAIVASYGLIDLPYNVSSGDAAPKSPDGKRVGLRSCDRILEDLVNNSPRGLVILLHLYSPNSPAALDAYLAGKRICNS